MQSSAVVAFRALVMLACVVGIPFLAISGSSWSEIAKKFQSVQWRPLLGLSEVESCGTGEADRSTMFEKAGVCLNVNSGAPLATPPSSANSAPWRHQDSPANPATPQPAEGSDAELAGIQQQLQRVGATYYLLEKWGVERQLYRFFCKVAVDGNAGYVHCFEATGSEPLEAMRQVLREVKSWRSSLTSTPSAS